MLQKWKSLLICACVKIVSKENGLLPGVLGDKWEASLFLFAAHELLLKSRFVGHVDV